MKKLLALLFSCFPVLLLAVQKDKPFWHLSGPDGIVWVNDARHHQDHIEMSGRQVSVVLRYGILPSGEFSCNYGMVWPMLRTVPNDTGGSLQRRIGWNPLDAVSINRRSMEGEHVDSIRLNGVLTVYSHFGGIHLQRIISPSVNKAGVVTAYRLTNAHGYPVQVSVGKSHLTLSTAKEEGVKGSYVIEQVMRGNGTWMLKGGESISFSAFLCAHEEDIPAPDVDAWEEISARQAWVRQLAGNLVLHTPDSVVNRMFAFAKIRACESIFQTKCGPMHSPGGEAYYAAIWANDQAEYANPFFPFTGYDYAIKSAMNAWRLFGKWMNDAWTPIPSSIIAEGDDAFSAAGDRGDAAMIAYGAARFALECGSREQAEELLPLITWCLEYCRRHINEDGVVTSESDELERRFLSGEANLCTSSLYYDALLSASYLCADLHRVEAETYRRQARQMRRAIDTYFHSSVEGFDTYQYYEGNTVLRSWICVPLTMGIFTRAEGTVRALFSPRLWTENGLLTQAGDRTFWDRSTLYALRGALMAGATEQALAFLKSYSESRLLGDHVPYAIEAWPEGNQRHLSAESALYARIFTEGLFGIRSTGLRRFTLSPRLPKDWEEMWLEKVHLCGETFSIHVYRQSGKVLVNLLRKGKTVCKTYSGQPVSFKL
ncbi:MAG: hypothetical protein K6A82_08175 [Prevotella sp.]|nr:hypothetical protein [Prevotella sp.]